MVMRACFRSSQSLREPCVLGRATEQVTVKHSCEEGSLGLLGADVFAQDIPKDKVCCSEVSLRRSECELLSATSITLLRAFTTSRGHLEERRAHAILVCALTHDALF